MAQVKFKRKTTSEIQDLPIDDGSFIVDYEQGEAYIDLEEDRVKFAGTTTVHNEKYSSEDEVYSTNYINDLRSIINIGLSDNTDTLSANTTIPFDTQVNITGGGLTFDSYYNGVVIGDDISFVNVSLLMAVQYNNSNTAYSVSIAKNGVDIPYVRAWATKDSSNVYSCTIPPMLIEVVSGDVITAVFKENSGKVRPETFLNVEVVK